MEVNEPASPAVPPSVGDPKFIRAEVIKVIFETPVRVAVNQATVPEPHWQKGVDVDEPSWRVGARQTSWPFSKRPAAYLRRSAGGSRVATVTVKVIASNLSGNGKLIGVLSSLRFEGDCPLGAGEHIVTVTLQNVPDEFNAFAGNMAWGLEGNELSTSLNATRAEVYFLFGAPHRAYQTGVWVEALRFLAIYVGLRGTTVPADGVGKIARYCHGAHGMRYDVFQGASSFVPGGGGGAFWLSGYMSNSWPIVNCYDQAGAVESLCGAAGIIVGWRYLQPFGYIRPTNLVGWGLCNNPFFGVNLNQRIIGINETARTSFGNHAFSEYAGKIVDACAGPHAGTETPAEYVDASIDTQTNLYQRRNETPGTAANIVGYAGVTGVW